MKALVLCLIDWLKQEPSTLEARLALAALASETLKRLDSPDSDQRKFDAEELAAACGRPEQDNYDAAKRWLNRAELPSFLAAREQSMADFFRRQGHSQLLTLQKTDTTGRHRARWFLLPKDLPDQDDAAIPEGVVSTVSEPVQQVGAVQPGVTAVSLVYEFTPPGQIKLSPLGRLLLTSKGQVVTLSGMGLVWASLPVLGGLVIFLLVGVVWSMTLMARPIQTNDLALMLMSLGIGWTTWLFVLRPLARLLEDRIAPAGELLTGWSEDPAQLDMAKDAERRYVRLVRYSGVCPICAGKIELRYGNGEQSRRLFGCCSEAPQEHRFTFDRVTRRGVLSPP